MAKCFKSLRLKMFEQEYSQLELSQATGICQSKLSSRLNGKYFWQADEILAVCRVLHIPIEDIPQYFFEDELQQAKQKKPAIRAVG